MEKESQTIFDKNVIEFVTVAAEFCAFLERAERMKRSTFVDTSLKILPLLYLKASMLPKCETIGDEAPETYVTEEIYEILRINLSGLMGDKDDYLDVFVQDMVYSDQPIKKSISEDLADIYQDIKDFIFVFQLGLNETMNDSLAICQENFGTLWGQKLVNTLRALHDVKYNQEEEEEEEEGTVDMNEYMKNVQAMQQQMMQNMQQMIQGNGMQNYLQQVQVLQQQLASGQISAEEYTAKVQQLAAQNFGN